MKVRLQQNQVTVRLTHDDLENLKVTGIISTMVAFPYRPLYAYLETIDVPEISANFTEEGLQFYFPTDQLAEWIEGAQVGFSAQVGEVKLIIEKELPKKSKS